MSKKPVAPTTPHDSPAPTSTPTPKAKAPAQDAVALARSRVADCALELLASHDGHNDVQHGIEHNRVGPGAAYESARNLTNAWQALRDAVADLGKVQDPAPATTPAAQDTEFDVDEAEGRR